MKKYLVGLVLIALLLIVVLFFIPPNQQFDLRVCSPKIMASLPHWVAMEEGYYAEAGLNVREFSVSDSKLMTQTLYNDDVDVLPAVSLVDVINESWKRPLKPKIFSHSRMAGDPPFEALTVPRGSKISTLKDLEGKTIAVYPGITSEQTVRYYLKINNVSTDSIKFIPIGPPEHIKLLQSGEADCSHIYEPFKTANLKGGKTRLISQSIYGTLTKESAIGVSVLSPKIMENEPEKALLFLKVWDKSIKFIKDNPKKAAEILSKKLNITEDVALNAVWVNATSSDEVDRSKLLETMKTMQAIGLVESSVVLSDEYLLPSKQ